MLKTHFYRWHGGSLKTDACERVRPLDIPFNARVEEWTCMLEVTILLELLDVHYPLLKYVIIAIIFTQCKKVTLEVKM